MTIELWAYDTPNGRKVSVTLEELELPCKVRVVNITKGEQHAPEFLRISPSNRIPQSSIRMDQAARPSACASRERSFSILPRRGGASGRPISAAKFPCWSD